MAAKGSAVPEREREKTHDIHLAYYDGRFSFLFFLTKRRSRIDEEKVAFRFSFDSTSGSDFHGAESENGVANRFENVNTHTHTHTSRR